MITMIKEKKELVNIIKSLAKDLDMRAEDIANDWNKQVRSINIKADLEIGNIPEWNITKNYGLIFTDELIKDIEDSINNSNDNSKSMKAQAEIIAPTKTNPAEIIAKIVNESIIKNPSDIKIGIDYGNGLSKSSMFGDDR